MHASNFAKELTNENIDSINYEDVLIVTLATGPAQGEPHGFFAATKNLDIYHYNAGVNVYNSPAEIEAMNDDTVIPTKKFIDKFPIAKNIKSNGLRFFNHDKDWQMVYMNYGNYLFVRNEIADKFLELVDSHEGKHRIWWLYIYWYDMLKECLGKKSDYKSPGTDINDVIMWSKNKSIGNKKLWDLYEHIDLIEENKKRDIYQLTKHNEKPKYIVYDKIADNLIYVKTLKNLKDYL